MHLSEIPLDKIDRFLYGIEIEQIYKNTNLSYNKRTYVDPYNGGGFEKYPSSFQYYIVGSIFHYGDYFFTFEKLHHGSEERIQVHVSLKKEDYPHRTYCIEYAMDVDEYKKLVKNESQLEYFLWETHKSVKRHIAIDRKTINDTLKFIEDQFDTRSYFHTDLVKEIVKLCPSIEFLEEGKYKQ